MAHPDDQAKQLDQSGQHFGEYGSKLKTSTLLNKQLKETHRKNRIRVYGSFYFFLAVVAYIWLSRLGFFYFINLFTGLFSKTYYLIMGQRQASPALQ